jgi:hypothetical protein
MATVDPTQTRQNSPDFATIITFLPQHLMLVAHKVARSSQQCYIAFVDVEGRRR